MRVDISLDRFSRLRGLDYKKIIVIAFLLRIILASAYDVFVTVTDKDPLLPDSKFYSVKGRYADLLFEGYSQRSFTKDLLNNDGVSQEIFIDILKTEKGKLPLSINGTDIFAYLIGIIYFIFGYFTIWVRVFNICVSMLSVYLLFRVAKRHFGDLAANLFLITALFLPVQLGYSITLSRDFIRVFGISFLIWVIYDMGGIWIRRPRM